MPISLKLVPRSHPSSSSAAAASSSTSSSSSSSPSAPAPATPKAQGAAGLHRIRLVRPSLASKLSATHTTRDRSDDDEDGDDGDEDEEEGEQDGMNGTQGSENGTAGADGQDDGDDDDDDDEEEEEDGEEDGDEDEDDDDDDGDQTTSRLDPSSSGMVTPATPLTPASELASNLTDAGPQQQQPRSAGPIRTLKLHLGSRPRPDMPRQRKPKVLRKKPLRDVLERLITQLKRRDTYGFFLEPVKAQDAPGYFDLITQPMDFSTMEGKMNRGEYKDPDQFKADLLLVTGNSQLYNPAGTLYHNEAKKLERWGLAAVAREGAAAILPTDLAGLAAYHAAAPSSSVPATPSEPKATRGLPAGAALAGDRSAGAGGTSSGSGAPRKARPIKVNLKATMSGPIKGLEAARKEAEKGQYLSAAVTFGLLPLPPGFEDESADTPTRRSRTMTADVEDGTAMGRFSATPAPATALTPAPVNTGETTVDEPMLEVKREEGEPLALARATPLTSRPRSESRMSTPEVGTKRDASVVGKTAASASSRKKRRTTMELGGRGETAEPSSSSRKFITGLSSTMATRLSDMSSIKFHNDGSLDLSSVDAVERRNVLLPQATGEQPRLVRPEVESIVPLHPAIQPTAETLSKPLDRIPDALGLSLSSTPASLHATDSHEVEDLPSEQRRYPFAIPTGYGLGSTPRSAPALPPMWPRHSTAGAAASALTGAPALPKGRQKELERDAQGIINFDDWSYPRSYLSRTLQPLDLGLYPGLLPSKWMRHIASGGGGRHSDAAKLPPYHISVSSSFDGALREELDLLPSRAMLEGAPPMRPPPPLDFIGAIAASASRGWLAPADVRRQMAAQMSQTVQAAIWGGSLGESYARSLADFVAGATRGVEQREVEREREDQDERRLEELERSVREEKRRVEEEDAADEEMRQAARREAQEEWTHMLQFLIPPVSKGTAAGAPTTMVDEDGKRQRTGSVATPAAAPTPRWDATPPLPSTSTPGPQVKDETKPALDPASPKSVKTNQAPPRERTVAEEIEDGTLLPRPLADWVRDEVLSPLTFQMLGILVQASEAVRRLEASRDGTKAPDAVDSVMSEVEAPATSVSEDVKPSTDDGEKRGTATRATATTASSAIQNLVTSVLTGHLPKSLARLAELSQASAAPVELDGLTPPHSAWDDEKRDKVEVEIEQLQDASQALGRTDTDGADGPRGTGAAAHTQAQSQDSAREMERILKVTRPLRYRLSSLTPEKVDGALSQYARLLLRLSNKVGEMRGTAALGVDKGEDKEQVEELRRAFLGLCQALPKGQVLGVGPGKGTGRDRRH